jgi:hypothetical protein
MWNRSQELAPKAWEQAEEIDLKWAKQLPRSVKNLKAERARKAWEQEEEGE